MMKFKEGRAVEVLRRADESCGSWFPAKIVSVDGHTYTVRFELLLTVEGEPVVEKVRKADIRPCPPPMDMEEERWVLGDIVEVFDLHSWRVGKVAKVLCNNRFVIRIFGSIQLKEFPSSSIRIRQAWYDNQWVMIGKVDGNEQISHDHTHFGSTYSKNLHSGARGGIHEEACIREIYGRNPFHKISSMRTAKRNIGSHLKPSPEDAITWSGKKRKATLDAGGSQLSIRTLPTQVDAISFPKIITGEKYMRATINDRMIGSSEMDVKMENTNMHATQPFPMPLQVVEQNSECSVASCSGNISPEYTIHDSQKSSRDIADSSFDEPGETYVCCAEDKLADNVHKLELHAYKSTVRALYASGPLSWEQESLLTNLRLSLHISNEEHLIQLRHLLSDQAL